MTAGTEPDFAPERIEHRIREYLAHPYADAPGRAAYYSPHATCFDPVGHPSVVGRAAIEARFSETVERGLSSKNEIDRLIVAGNKAAADFSADVLKDGNRAFACKGVMVFEFDQDLLIDRLEVFLAK